MSDSSPTILASAGSPINLFPQFQTALRRGEIGTPNTRLRGADSHKSLPLASCRQHRLSSESAQACDPHRPNASPLGDWTTIWVRPVFTTPARARRAGGRPKWLQLDITLIGHFISGPQRRGSQMRCKSPKNHRGTIRLCRALQPTSIRLGQEHPRSTCGQPRIPMSVFRAAVRSFPLRPATSV